MALVALLGFAGCQTPTRAGTCAPYDVPIAESASPPKGLDAENSVAAGVVTPAAEVAPAPRLPGRVEIYWDVSKSMRPSKAAVGALVETLDSRVLPRAGAQGAVSHFLVGATLDARPNALGAMEMNAEWTALHDVARRAGADLGSGLVDVALIVSDLDMEVPPALRLSGTPVCPGAASTTSKRAGAFFGTCFESGLDEAGGGKLVDLMAGVVRVPFDKGEIYMLVVGTNLALVRKILDETRDTIKLAPGGEIMLVDTGVRDPSGKPNCNFAEGSGLVTEADAGANCKLSCSTGAVAPIHCTTGWDGTTGAVVGFGVPLWTLDVTAAGQEMPEVDERRRAALQTSTLSELELQVNCSGGLPGDGQDMRIRAMVEAPWTANGELPADMPETAKDLLDSLTRSIVTRLEPARRGYALDLYGG